MLIKLFDLQQTIDRVLERFFDDGWFAIWPLGDL